MSDRLLSHLLKIVEDHVMSDVEREVGGVLVGTISTDGPSISAVIPALAAVGSTANVTFTQEVWEDVHQRIDRDHPGAQIVGWYHSHPGFGIFLSAYDLFIHENFFPDTGQLALVVDPLAGEAGWFGWRDGSVVELERFPVRSVAATAQRGRTQGVRGPSGGNWRTAALLGLPVVALAGFVAGQLLAPADQLAGGSPLASASSEEGATHAESLEADLEAARDHIAELERDLRALQEDGASPTGDGSAITEPVHIAYTVGRGDTLWGIAAAVYGDGNRWTRIADANPSVEPAALVVGTRLRLPVTADDLFTGPTSDGDKAEEDTG